MYRTFEPMSRDAALATLLRGGLGHLGRPNIARLGRAEPVAQQLCPVHGVEVVMMCEDIANAHLNDDEGAVAMQLAMPPDVAGRVMRGDEASRTHIERIMRAEWN